MNDRTEDALAHFVAELVDIVFPLAAALEHMHRWRETRRSAPDAPPPAATLGMLLHGILTDVGRRHGAANLSAAAALLDDAHRVVCEELLFMPLDEPPRCIPGRRRGRG